MKSLLFAGLVVGAIQSGFSLDFRIEKNCSTLISREAPNSKAYKLGSSIISDERRMGIWKEARKNTKMSLEHIETEDGENIYVLELPEAEEKELYRLNWQLPSSPTKTLKELEADGKRQLTSLLPDLASEFRFSNSEVEYEAINGSQVITEVRLRFSRLLEGDEIMKSVSYLYLEMDGRAKAKRIKLKYPEILATGTKTASSRNSREVLNDLSDHCRQRSHLKLMRSDAIQKARSTKITACVNSWLPMVQEDGSIGLTRSFSFYSIVGMGGEEKFSKVIHVPLDKSLHIDDERFDTVSKRAKRQGVFVHRGENSAPVVKVGRE